MIYSKTWQLALHIIEAALIHAVQITVCNAKGVTGSDEPKENYYATLQFPSPLPSFHLISACVFFVVAVF